ncbi:TetR/AcrR family transcriptional regulator [Fructobacillus americanaquae]|uniref:TetR/AcrR family transcriptional regulator n=1 Tax=Fructobacillus americanaquae TaxID=2940302 RepID=A0ABY5C192_9LACO|nr:TetR/AcrR family transcriptional regulator [Fructobacillus americanaquae]USS92542.1 TetR/AcrR family transcriptional regulator [Fructobacillus americanaquae]
MENKRYDLMHRHLLLTTGELLHDIPFSKIKVKEICDAAEVNRNTFYRHFVDKYVLLDELLNTSVQSIYATLDLDQFKKFPFETIKTFHFDGTIEVLEFQLQDRAFEDLFYKSIFKALSTVTTDQELLWLIGNLYVVQLWNTSRDTPYDLRRDYHLLDQIVANKQFPTANASSHSK